MNREHAKTFNLRIPPELREWLEAEAKRNLRSLNNEIVFKLNECKAIEEDKRVNSPGQGVD